VLTRLFEHGQGRIPSEQEITEAFREELHRQRTSG